MGYKSLAVSHPFRVVLCWTYRGLTGGFLLLRNFSAALSVSPHVYFSFNSDFCVSKIWSHPVIGGYQLLVQLKIT